MTEILIASAAASNYEGMDALVGEDGRVYLGRSENYCPGDGEAPAFYDNSDNSLQLISDNIKMFHFLYGEGWPVSQRQMRRERCFTKADYIEFASLRDGVLSHYRPIREVTFAGRPFVPPKAYEPGGNAPMELEASLFTDPATKNSADLAIYAANAWNSGWGYVWGTFGQVLTPELLQYKISQYPEGVGDEANFIRSHWLNRRTTDCVGLIKGYGWLNTETMEIQYGSNGMPDVGADGMYYNAGRKGSIETMPDTPGLAVWKSGHIGVYIGSGEVIEAMDTRYGVVKTKLQGRGWSHWLEVPGIKYD